MEQVDKAPAGHLLSPNEDSSTENGLHVIGLLSKGILWKTQTSHVAVKMIGYSPKTNSKVPLVNIYTTQWTWRNIVVAYIGPLPIQTSIIGISTTLHTTKGETKQQSTYKSFSLQ